MKSIYLDMDDVLNEFTQFALKARGCVLSGLQDYDPDWGWDIITAATMLHPSEEFTWETFWHQMPEWVWSNCPVSPGAYSLIAAAEEWVGPDNVYILSTPSACPMSASGKVRWIQANLPDFLHDQYILTRKKHLLASPTSLLIDDGEHNISAFADAGGDVILFPKPWNSMHPHWETGLDFAMECIKELREYE